MDIWSNIAQLKNEVNISYMHITSGKNATTNTHVVNLNP